MLNGMRYDFSWNPTGAALAEIYHHIWSKS